MKRTAWVSCVFALALLAGCSANAGGAGNVSDEGGGEGGSNS